MSPLEPHDGVGAAFRQNFFEEQRGDTPTSWRTDNLGPAAYDRLVGAKVVMRPLDAAPEPLTVTPEGERWLGADVSRRLAGARVDVCRPSPRDRAELVLVDSPAGPVLASSRLGGQVDSGDGAASSDRPTPGSRPNRSPPLSAHWPPNRNPGARSGL